MPFGGLLTVGLISAGGALGSAAIGSNAANKAGNLIYDKGNQVGGSIDKATGGAIAAGYAGVGQANTALDTGLSGATGAINTGVGNANDQLAKLLQPYISAGGGGLAQLSSLLAPGGSMSSPISPDMMKDDPGYQFRLSEGLKEIEHSAAARGGVMSGATVKDEGRYAQNYASSEYQNAFSRALAGRQQQFDMLRSLANFGETSATNLGDRASSNIMTGAGTIAGADLGVGGQKASTAMQGGQYIGNVGLEGANLAGNAYMGGALGKAAGDITSGNAWSSALGNVGSTLGGLLTLNNWNKSTGVQGTPGDYPVPPLPQISG